MTLMQWRLCALVSLLPFSAAINAAQSDPTNASADAPSAQYESTFKSYIAAADDSVSPEKGWRAANDGVADKPGQGHKMGMQMGDSMSMPMPGKPVAPSTAGNEMVMPDGSTMPMEKHNSAPNATDMKVPMDKAMKMPGGAAMPMHKDMKKPAPAPKGDASMPGMDMSHEHSGKGH